MIQVVERHQSISFGCFNDAIEHGTGLGAVGRMREQPDGMTLYNNIEAWWYYQEVP